MTSGFASDFREVTAPVNSGAASSAKASAGADERPINASCIDFKNAGTSSADVRVFGLDSHAIVNSVASLTVFAVSSVNADFLPSGLLARTS